MKGCRQIRKLILVWSGRGHKVEKNLYLQQLSNKLECDLSTKHELLDEFKDHLMLLREEYIEKGLSDDIAEKCASITIKV